MKVENIKKDKTSWSVEVDGNKIVVENTPNEIRLFVNEKLQDKYIGLIGSPKLIGLMSDGKLVNVSICGNFKMRCLIFVNGELVLEA